MRVCPVRPVMVIFPVIGSSTGLRARAGILLYINILDLRPGTNLHNATRFSNFNLLVSFYLEYFDE
jgi:hypothetical protein